jgi:hypothetical protein
MKHKRLIALENLWWMTPASFSAKWYNISAK